MPVKPLVSLVIPVYNAVRYLPETLRSVLNQTLPPETLEVIAVDDGSTDGSLDLLRLFAKDRANTTIVDLPVCSGAPGIPRNRGVLEVTGRYIQFLDADDILEPWACEVLLSRIQETESDIVCGTHVVFEESYSEVGDTSVGELPKIFRLALPQPLTAVRADDHPEVFATPPAIWSRIYDRTFLENAEIVFTDDAVAQDAVFNVETLLRARSVTTIRDVICRYRRRDAGGPVSVSNNLDPRFFADLVHTRVLIRELFARYSRLDYYDVLYEIHLRYAQNRFLTAMSRGRSDMDEIVAIIRPFFAEFPRLYLEFEPPVTRLITELIGCGMVKELRDILDLLESQDLIVTERVS